MIDKRVANSGKSTFAPGYQVTVQKVCGARSDNHMLAHCYSTLQNDKMTLVSKYHHDVAVSHGRKSRFLLFI